MNAPWARNAFFYHIYPLGCCGAPKQNDFQSAPVMRLEKLYAWLDSIQELGANALYLGPLFESSEHGYDTADYYHVDRRLGDRATLAAFSRELHRRGMRLVLDGVFNHTGRYFWAFRDILANGSHSPYTAWYQNLDFSRRSPYGDPFSYEGWAGHHSLAKLNLANPEVRQHLFGAVEMWVSEFEIDGLRLDAADQIDPDFLAALATHARGLREDFWLMGEMVFGDYRRLLGGSMLDSVTNYEAYKGLFSSHNDRNYFEIAYTLNRQFGEGGIYRDFDLYSFADNHDVDRVASSLKTPAHLYPLYILMFGMPGIPSIYYGSEWGIPGLRSAHSDEALRPALDPGLTGAYPHPDLAGAIRRLARLRAHNPALRRGDYQQLHVSAEQFAFLRGDPEQQVVVAVNAAVDAAELNLRLPVREGWLEDVLNPGERFPIQGGEVHLPIAPVWGRILAHKYIN